jgi:hypothetical protein
MLYKMHIVASKKDVVVPKYDTQLDALHNYLRYYKALIKERVIKTNQLEAALHRGDETVPFYRSTLVIKSCSHLAYLLALRSYG